MANISEILTNLTNKVNEIDKKVYPYNFLTFTDNVGSSVLTCTTDWKPTSGKYYVFNIVVKSKNADLQKIKSTSCMLSDGTNDICYFTSADHGVQGSELNIWNITLNLKSDNDRVYFYSPQKYKVGVGTFDNVSWPSDASITMWYQEITPNTTK